MIVLLILQISEKFLNIYSQNSHQNLLGPKSQLSILDSFANNDKLLKKVIKTHFTSYKK